MRLLTIVVCFSAAAAWFGATEARPFENFFQTFKEMGKKMAGGDANPMVQMGQQMMDSIGADDWQKKVHDTASQFMEKADEDGKKMMQEWMQNFEKMKSAGASQEEMKGKFTKLMEAMNKQA